MSHSDDEDDFLSADEDVDAGEVNRRDVLEGPNKRNVGLVKSSNIGVISIDETNPGTLDSDAKVAERGYDTSEDKIDESNEEESVEKQQTVKAKSAGQIKREPHSNEDEEDEESEAEEEALVERIRERNLRIARNFSAEIAKNLKVSAPIPVKSTGSPRREIVGEDSEISPGSSHNKSTHLPPAPPPTPALSSSFNNLSEQNTLGTSPSLGTQYSWRIPPKVATTSTAITASNVQRPSDTSSSLSSSESRPGDQARVALDRLANKLSQPDRNLFERVASDIRNVSIKGDDSINPVEATSQIAASLPSTISDLGNTLGSWGWSGATTLLSSATQVTSQVGSVISSVSQQLQPTYQLHQEDSTKCKKNAKDD